MRNKKLKGIAIRTAVTILVAAVAEIENIVVFKWFMKWYESQLPKSLEEALSRTDYIPPRELFIGIFFMLALFIIPLAIKMVQLVFKEEIKRDNEIDGIGYKDIK